MDEEQRMMDETARKFAVPIAKMDKKRLIVNGYEYTSYRQFNISILFDKLFDWQVITMPDASGRVCKQICIPLIQNGIEWNAKRNCPRWNLSSVIAPSFSSYKLRNMTHFIVPHYNPDYLAYLDSHGMYTIGSNGLKVYDTVIGYIHLNSPNYEQGNSLMSHEDRIG